jgi:hypothetical protein
MSETPQTVLSLPLWSGLASIAACIHEDNKEKDITSKGKSKAQHVI